MKEEYSYWQDFFEEEERLARMQYEEEMELSRQERQIKYEAEARRGFPLRPMPEVSYHPKGGIE